MTTLTMDAIMESGRSGKTVRDKLMKDIRPIDRIALADNVALYRKCSYIHAASEKQQSIVLNGGIDIMLGGIIPLPEFNNTVEKRIFENLTRAIHWINTGGFVPFSVEIVTKQEQGGANVGIGSGTVLDMMERDREAERPNSTGTHDDPASSPPPYSLMEPSDFSFSVPSLGVGEYKCYLDARDNCRRIYCVDDTEETDEDEDRKSTRVNWFVYQVEEPSVDGVPNCRMTRLKERHNYISDMEMTELRGMKLGFRPRIVTEPLPPGHGLKNATNFFNTASDTNVIEMGAKDPHGMPAGFRSHIDNVDRRWRDVIESTGQDPDQMLTHHGSRMDTDREEFRVSSGRKHAGFIVPHKIVDVSQKEREYVSRVAVEFGMPASDLAETGSRYSEDRSQHAITLVETGRRLRSILTDLLYRVFELRNQNRLKTGLRAVSKGNHSYVADLKTAAGQIAQLLEKARKQTLTQSSVSATTTISQRESQQQQQQQPVESDGDVQQNTVPESVEELVTRMNQLENSFLHIGHIQRSLDAIVDSRNLLTIRWKHPIIVDTSQIGAIAEGLRLDDTQHANILRYHYGLDT